MQQTKRKLVLSLVTLAGVAVALFTLQAQAQTEKILYTFGGGTDGSFPSGGLVSDANGNYTA